MKNFRNGNSKFQNIIKPHCIQFKECNIYIYIADLDGRTV